MKQDNGKFLKKKIELKKQKTKQKKRILCGGKRERVRERQILGVI